MVRCSNRRTNAPRSDGAKVLNIIPIIQVNHRPDVLDVASGGGGGRAILEPPNLRILHRQGGGFRRRGGVHFGERQTGRAIRHDHLLRREAMTVGHAGH